MQLYALLGIVAVVLLSAVGIRSCIYNDAVDDLRLQATELLRQKEQEERERADMERDRADTAEDKADDALARGEALAQSVQKLEGREQCPEECFSLSSRAFQSSP